MEVRYHAGNKLTHELWLDYGPSETIFYAKHSLALQETKRLSPEILAQVDPSAFWSCVVHYKVFVKTLRDLRCESELIDKWLALEGGIKESRQDIVNIWGTFIIPDENGNWQIQNDQQHEAISLKNAQAAIVTVMAKVRALDGSANSLGIDILDY